MQQYVFDDERKSIKIKKTDLPQPWINYLSNGTMHGFVSQAGGGTLWLYDNASTCRISRYRSFNIPIDSPGFYIYIKDEKGNVWSPAFRPTEMELDSFTAEHMAGKSMFYAEKDGTKAILKIFITPDYDVCVWDLEIVSNTDKIFDVFAYMELSQLKISDEFNNGYYWRHMLKTWYDEKTSSVQYLYHNQSPQDAEKTPLIYFTSDRKVLDYCGDRDAFLGNYRTERNPVSVERGYCGNETIQSGEPCCALHISVDCKENESQKTLFLLGSKKGGLVRINEVQEEIYKDLTELRNINTIIEQEKKSDDKWTAFLSKFECEIPDKTAQRQINIWGPIASMHTARYSRSINTNAPGVRLVGTRDTCQDMLAISYRDEDFAKKTLLYLLSGQYREGWAIHTIGLLGKQTRKHMCCDDHLWFSFLVYSLLSETGDLLLLNEKAPYLAEDHSSKDGEGTVWEHLLKAVEFTQNHLGTHGLPLTLKGDWNDIIHKFSEKGLGESIFAAQQYVKVLEMMIEIAEAIDDTASLEKFKIYKENQKDSILKNCWNGDWWYRCFDDEANPIGGQNDEFGKIWLNSQSWAVIGNIGTFDMQKKAMDEVSDRLDTGVGLMKLSPGFETWPYVKNPFSGYNPGTGENGAVFCHAHTWAIIAEAILGNANRAWKYYNDLVPHNALNKMGIEKYKAEPYTWCSNIVGYPNNKKGWGNVSHISGSAAWMNVAATQYLLGVRPNLKGVIFDPCIPADWDRVKIKREYRGSVLNIEIDNTAHVQKNVKCVEVNGKIYNGNFIDQKVFIDNKLVAVKVIMS